MSERNIHLLFLPGTHWICPISDWSALSVCNMTYFPCGCCCYIQYLILWYSEAPYCLFLPLWQETTWTLHIDSMTNGAGIVYINPAYTCIFFLRSFEHLPWFIVIHILFDWWTLKCLSLLYTFNPCIVCAATVYFPNLQRYFCTVQLRCCCQWKHLQTFHHQGEIQRQRLFPNNCGCVSPGGVSTWTYKPFNIRSGLSDLRKWDVAPLDGGRASWVSGWWRKAIRGGRSDVRSPWSGCEWQDSAGPLNRASNGPNGITWQGLGKENEVRRPLLCTIPAFDLHSIRLWSRHLTAICLLAHLRGVRPGPNEEPLGPHFIFSDRGTGAVTENC